MPFYLGIDGGGTQTTCALGNESAELARAVGAASNPIRVGEEQSRAALAAVIHESCERAGVKPADLASVCAGMAGGGREATAVALARMLAEITPAAVQVVGDHEVALQAAAGGGPGLVVLAGTGSIAYGRNTSGQTARAGGWGWAISDEGSAHWIGRAGVAAAMRAHDGGETTLLVSSIMNTWHLGTRDDVVRMANSTPPADFAALFPAILAAAGEGDSLAREVLMQAGAELAQLAKLVLRRLWPGQEPAIAVGAAGGVFRHAPLVRQIFANTLRSEYASADLRAGVIDPVAGALALARILPARSGNAGAV